MKIIKYIYLAFFLLLSIFSCSTFATAIVKTNSSTYFFEGGAKFKDGQVKTQTSSGDLFYTMGENERWDWVGKGAEKDQYNEYYGGYGWTSIKRTTNSFNQLVGQDYYGYSDNDTVLNFMKSFIEWDFTVLNDNAWLDTTIVTGTGSAHFNLFNITSGIDSFDSGNLNSWEIFEEHHVLLEQGNRYRISSLMNNSAGGDGWEIYNYLRFDNASISIAAPSTLLVFIFGLMVLLNPQKYLIARSRKFLNT
ncbi:hypothetical protein CXF72_12350 [Psychromonas sp. MB-3u-54]|uniref:hypothetical protein n=1 Tax=Psychromonas sp. MB-3u-54 TaxID=2058319 RepID=UPI000C34974F|nr:hypothetical protein [Psychromonas sp. MB-3u-54]PKH02275.1 hypothetical protein CXF72_12350 [Psychromonas sp. MB-3u-54]